MSWQKIEASEELDTQDVESVVEAVEQMTKRRGRPPRSKLSSDSSHDPVNHPAHYTAGGIETIDYIEAKGLNYHLGNVVKYVSRAGKKGVALEDLKKAKWYLEREIQRLEKPSE